MSTASVSVVIPSYNGAEYLHDTLASVLRQTVLPDEIIVVDDCSRDGTVAVVEAFALTSPVPARLLRMRRNSGGPARPLNAGVAAATSDLIAVLEQDDRMTPTRLASSLDAWRAFPAAGLIFGRVRMSSPGGHVRDDLWKDGRSQFDGLVLKPIADRVYRVDPDDVVAALLRRNIVFTNSNAVFPRSAWRRVGGFDPSYRICSDLEFNLKVARVAPVLIIDEVLCDYYQRPDSLYNSNAATRGDSLAQYEALFARTRHALQHYEARSGLADEWFWNARYLLASAWRRRELRRCARVAATLCSTRTLPYRVIKTLRRLVSSA